MSSTTGVCRPVSKVNLKCGFQYGSTHQLVNGKKLAKKRLVQKTKGKGKMKTEQKKEYRAPQMRSVELRRQANLMQGSGLEGKNGTGVELA